MKLSSLVRLAFVLAKSASRSSAATIDVRAAIGSWSPILDLPLSPISGALLPTGEFVLWAGKNPGGWADNTLGTTQTNYVIMTLDQLVDGSPLHMNITKNPEMFCPGTTNLVNGDLLVNGGSGPEATILFDLSTKSWKQGGLMNIPRGYNSNALTISGNVFTIGGSFAKSFFDKRTNHTFGLGGKDGELWTPSSEGGTWMITNKGSGNIIGGIEDGSTSPDPQGIYRSDNHAWLFPYKSTAGEDKIFHAGPSHKMHDINISNGTTQYIGNRGADPYSINGNAVQYIPGHVLKFGGAPYYGDTHSSVGKPTTATALMLNYTGMPNGGLPIVTSAGKMNFPRSFGHSVVLPGGKILIVGGQTAIHLFSDETGVLTPEIYDPIYGTFTKVADMATARNYHSLAMLMKDGSVIIAGGGAAQNRCSVSGQSPCTPDVHFNAEVYSPPYLDSGNERPVISHVSTGVLATYGPQLSVGAEMNVSTSGCGSVCSYELIRLHSATHSVNNDQARVPLEIVKRDMVKGDIVTIDRTYAAFIIPGYYYLFAISSKQTPSVASIVHVV